MKLTINDVFYKLRMYTEFKLSGFSYEILIFVMPKKFRLPVGNLQITLITGQFLFNI